MTTTKQKFILKVQNAEDLNNSTLFWKYLENNNINQAQIFANYVDKVEFQIEAKPGKIVYWYRNSKFQEENEQMRRKYDLKEKQKIEVDKFNCQNVVLKCQVSSQDFLNNTQMFYITEERNQKIEFNKENLIYLPFGKQATFLLENQGAEQLYTEVKFITRLDQRNYIGNSLQLPINRDNLANCLIYVQTPHRFRSGNIEFEIIERIQNEEILFFRLQNQQYAIERQSNNMDSFITMTQQLETKLSSINLNSLENLSQLTKQNNFFSEEKQSNQNTIMPADTLSQSIIFEQKKPVLEKNLFKTQKLTDIGKQEQQLKNKTNQTKKQVDMTNYINQKKVNQQEIDQQDDTKSQQAIDLQPITYYNNSQQYDESSQQAIQEQNEMIKKLKEQHSQQIEELRLQIKQLGFELRCEKEKIEDFKRMNTLKFIQNFRERKFIPSFGDNENSKLVRSTTNFFLPPIQSYQKNVVEDPFIQTLGQTRFQRNSKNNRQYTQVQ